uniref:Uncharacterized protein n=1 Tax=Eutreptiella gymnastica TaxID=73025 RepID=A0A7S1N4R4_9EUGL
MSLFCLFPISMTISALRYSVAPTLMSNVQQVLPLGVTYLCLFLCHFADSFFPLFAIDSDSQLQLMLIVVDSICAEGPKGSPWVPSSMPYPHSFCQIVFLFFFVLARLTLPTRGGAASARLLPTFFPVLGLSQFLVSFLLHILPHAHDAHSRLP